jgi:hypothetical protein
MSLLTVTAINHGDYVAPISGSLIDASGTVPVLQIKLPQAGSYVVMGKGEIYNTGSDAQVGMGALYLLPTGNSPLIVDFTEVRLNAADNGADRQCISLLGKHNANAAGDVIYLGFQTLSGACGHYSLAAILSDNQDWYEETYTGQPKQPVPGYTK